MRKRKILEYDLETVKIKRPERWNKKWYVVMFDIPETRKRARQAVSSKIKELGMYPLQKSTFISPYPCKDEIDFVGEFFKVRKYIIYIEATELEGAEKVRRHFGL